MIIQKDNQRILEVGQSDLEGPILGLGGVYDYLIIHTNTYNFDLSTVQYNAFKPLLAPGAKIIYTTNY